MVRHDTKVTDVHQREQDDDHQQGIRRRPYELAPRTSHLGVHIKRLFVASVRECRIHQGECDVAKTATGGLALERDVAARVVVLRPVHQPDNGDDNQHGHLQDCIRVVDQNGEPSGEYVDETGNGDGEDSPAYNRAVFEALVAFAAAWIDGGLHEDAEL